MGARDTERLHSPEGFPDINRGGNLVFCALADEAKLAKLLGTGIQPRGGYIEPGSLFPEAVSLAATTSSLEASTGHIWSPIALNEIRRRERFDPEAFRYVLVVDPKYIAENATQFLFVGEKRVFGQWSRLRVGSLSNVPITEAFKQDAMFNEVHYLGGTLSPRYLVGVAISEKSEDKFERATAVVKSAVSSVRRSLGNQLPGQFALYNAQGQLFDIAA